MAKSYRSHYRMPPMQRQPRSAAGITGDPKKIETIQEAAAAILMASDGYANMAAFIGENSPLMASGTYVRNNLTWDQELLSTTYRVNWLAKKIIDMPAEDMTRAWYKPVTRLPAEDIDTLLKLEAVHNIRQEITDAIRWARLYGGSIAVICLLGDDGKKLDKSLDTEILLPGAFQGLLVLDRTEVTPSMETVSDLKDPDFGLPEYYTAELNAYDEDRDHQGPRTVRIHHSRVLRFTGRELPRRESIREDLWGASELEHCWEELLKRSAASANIAQLMFQANITTLKMGNLGSAMTMGSDHTREHILQMIENENRLRTSYGLQIMSADDSMENHPYSFAGMAEIYEAFMMDMAGAAEIPATKLFGRSPQGMNATGEADLRNYYDMIAQKQERMLRPALEKLLPVMALSCWGMVPEDMEIVFEPVMTVSPSERAALSRQLADEVAQLIQCGAITPEEGRAELQSRGKMLGSWEKLG